MKLKVLYAGIFLLLSSSVFFSCEKHEASIDYSLRVGNIYCQDGRILPPETYDTSSDVAVAIITAVGDETQDFKAIGVGLDEWQDNLLNMNRELNGVNGDLDDMAGKANTAAIITLLAQDTTLLSPAINAIREYKPGDSSWHLPSCGELMKLSANRGVVNSSLRLVGGQPLSDDYYLSSTQDGTSEHTSTQFMRNVSLFEGRVIGSDKTSVKTVRPFLMIQ